MNVVIEYPKMNAFTGRRHILTLTPTQLTEELEFREFNLLNFMLVQVDTDNGIVFTSTEKENPFRLCVCVCRMEAKGVYSSSKFFLVSFHEREKEIELDCCVDRLMIFS